MTNRRRCPSSWQLVAGLAAVAIAGCDRKAAPEVQPMALPDVAKLLDMTAGCDPDAVAARFCFVFPVTDLQEVIGRPFGTWGALRDKLALEHVRIIEVARSGVTFAQLMFDDNGRFERQRRAGEPNTDWQVEYDGDGKVVRFEEAKGTHAGGYVRSVGDVCVVVNDADATMRACKLEGEQLRRDQDRYVVKATQRAGRLELATGDREVRDAQGRITEKVQGGTLRTIEYTPAEVKTFVAADGQRTLEETIDLGPNGLPVRQVMHTAKPELVLTFSYPAFDPSAIPPAEPGPATPPAVPGQPKALPPGHPPLPPNHP
ncbi:MAG: hypothetical protein AB7O24_18785 [Kofleriaceae bacterium]